MASHPFQTGCRAAKSGWKLGPSSEYRRACAHTRHFSVVSQVTTAQAGMLHKPVGNQKKSRPLRGQSRRLIWLTNARRAAKTSQKIRLRRILAHKRSTGSKTVGNETYLPPLLIPDWAIPGFSLGGRRLLDRSLANNTAVCSDNLWG